MKVQQIEIMSPLANSLEHGDMQRIRVADRAVKTQCLRPTWLQVGRGLRIAACEQDNVMPERNQFVGQPRNNALGASIKLRRNGLSQRGYLRDLHAIILSVNSTGLARDIAKPRFLPAPNRTSTRATTARPWQLCSARLTVAEAGSLRSRFLDQHVPRLKQELEVHNGFHRSPLVPRHLKILKYIFPCAVWTAQCRLSNELNRFGCAVQYNRRARADAQLRIDWKVTHSQLTPSCGSSSIHHTTFVFRCRAIKTVARLELPLEAEGCLIEERRVAVKASLSVGLNAAPCVKGSLKTSSRPVFTKPRV